MSIRPAPPLFLAPALAPGFVDTRSIPPTGRDARHETAPMAWRTHAQGEVGVVVVAIATPLTLTIPAPPPPPPPRSATQRHDIHGCGGGACAFFFCCSLAGIGQLPYLPGTVLPKERRRVRSPSRCAAASPVARRGVAPLRFLQGGTEAGVMVLIERPVDRSKRSILHTGN